MTRSLPPLLELDAVAELRYFCAMASVYPAPRAAMAVPFWVRFSPPSTATLPRRAGLFE